MDYPQPKATGQPHADIANDDRTDGHSWTWFHRVSRAHATLRLVLLIACLLGLLTTIPLWSNSRPFPLLPLTDWIPTLPRPWDQWFFVLVLCSLFVAVRFYRPGVLIFLVGTLFLYMADQNRGQPWLYIYWIMLVLTLLPEAGALAGCRLVLSLVYIWGGIQKCHTAYFKTIAPWFVQPASEWGLPTWLVTALGGAVAAAPVIEIFIGGGVWHGGIRAYAIGAAVAVHAVALLFLGPWGHQYNAAVWPWNLAMIALVVALFSNETRLQEAWRSLRNCKPALAVVLLVGLLPVLSYFGRWDSYFSFALYSGSEAKADMGVTARFQEQLPPAMRPFVHPVAQAYDPRWQAPFVFDHLGWAMGTLGAPSLIEPRGYRAVYQYLRAYAPSDADLRMVIMPRAGPITFHQGDQVFTLIPNASPTPSNPSQSGP